MDTYYLGFCQKIMLLQALGVLLAGPSLFLPNMFDIRGVWEHKKQWFMSCWFSLWPPFQV